MKTKDIKKQILEKFAIVIPCYNEKNNLKLLLSILVENHPSAYVFVVDDNSPDKTADFVNSFSKKYPKVKLILREEKMGRGSAVLAGIKKALMLKDVDYVLEMDADFSHDPKDIKEIIKKASPNTLVIGSRYTKGGKTVNWPPRRRILSKLANFYARAILGVPINDYTNGFRLYPKKISKLILSQPMHEKGYALLSETAFVIHKAGFSFKETPIVFVNRKIGKSNTTISEYLKSLIAVIKIRLNH